MATQQTGWQEGKSLVECNRYMLTNSISTDVTFIVGENRKQVRAHKYVLGSRSSVFYAMLFGPLAESSDTITIPDTEPDIFKEILRYLYHEELTVNEDNVMLLMIAADKYNMADIFNNCMEFLNCCISIDSCCTVLDIANLFGKCDLIAKCLQFICKNFCDVIQSSSFCTLSKDSLKLIMQSEKLDADESLVYQAAKKWAEYQCRSQGNDVNDYNIRRLLGELIKLIRFPIMDMKYFIKNVSNGNVLTAEEKVEIFEQQFDTPRKENAIFISKERKIKQTPQICIRGTVFGNSWQQDGDPDSINFRVSERVKILGFVMCAGDYPVEFDIEAKLMKSSTVLDEMKTKITTSKGQKTFNVMLKNGVFVDKNVLYTAQVKLIGTRTKVCSTCLPSVTVDGVEFQFSTADQPNNGTSATAGQIPGIVFIKKR